MKDDMPVNLKHRLLGAVVVVLLIVIFVPTLFESDRDQPESIIATNIPPISDEVASVVFQMDADGEFKRVDISPQSNDAQNNQSSLPNNGPSSHEFQTVIPQENIDSAVVLNKDLAKPVVLAAAVLQPTPVVVKSVSKLESQGKGAEHWMVQLGSFSKENNAKVLHDKLRAKHFSVSLDSLISANKKWWRVRVGPQPNKVRALAAQKILKKETGLQGMLVQMKRLER